jgi:hypothetical protein
MGDAVLSLVAAGPLMPAVPAVLSFEPERLHATMPPASTAISVAAMVPMQIILSGSVKVVSLTDW